MTTRSSTICWDCSRAYAHLCPRFDNITPKPLKIWDEYIESLQLIGDRREKTYIVLKCKNFVPDSKRKDR